MPTSAVLRARASTRSIFAAGLLLAGSAYAEQIPVRVYTTADGLGRDHVLRILPDSRGFLWFGTSEGLSRFDGVSFATYGTGDGLPHRAVNDLLEARDGRFWVATGSGVAALAPGSSRDRGPRGPRFTVVSGEAARSGADALLQDRGGTIWCATRRGLARIAESGDGMARIERVDIGGPAFGDERDAVAALAEDSQGVLWVGGASGLYRRRPDGRAERFTAADGLPATGVTALLADADGRLWVGTQSGLAEIEPAAADLRPVVTRTYGPTDGLAAAWVQALFRSASGALWVGTTKGLSSSVGTGNGIRTFRPIEGIRALEAGVGAIAEDHDGNLWLGTEAAGAAKLVRSGWTSFGESDGLDDTRIAAVFEDRAGELCVVGSRGGLYRFDGGRFVRVPFALRKPLAALTWGWNQITFQDRKGAWWVPTTDGLFRMPVTAGARDLAGRRYVSRHTPGDGLAGTEAFRAFEDSSGDVWVASVTPGGDMLHRFDRRTSRFESFGAAQGIPVNAMPTAFREDAAGRLWIGHFYGGVSVRHEDGFRFFAPGDGVPAGQVRDLYLDRERRLWVATSRGGVGRLDSPGPGRPRFVTYDASRGLASDEARCVTEDDAGRIYVGTGRGVDRLDLVTGEIRHYTVADGLASSETNVAFRDRHGSLWFGTLRGLSRFVPSAEIAPPPPVYITAITVAGVAAPLSDLGETDVTGLDLAPDQNHVRIAFAAPSFGAGDVTRYQYRLAGADRDWTEPLDQRAVTYARLAPGSYRFEVRAVRGRGQVSALPASLAFTVAPPLWRRGWFVLLAATASALLLVLLYRYRVAHLVAVERVRTRIATDLHDDIGSSLSRIAILSEVARRDVEATHGEAGRLLGEIAGTARGLVDATSDIVWSIDPRHDDLDHLVARIREFAADVFDAKGIAWDLDAPSGDSLRLDPDQRRHLFLIFKEAMHNIVRHARCGAVAMRLEIAERRLRAEIRDDGRGFAPADASGAAPRGHGLANMRARAAELGGSLEIVTAPGGGAVLTLDVPLSRPGA